MIVAFRNAILRSQKFSNIPLFCLIVVIDMIIYLILFRFEFIHLFLEAINQKFFFLDRLNDSSQTAKS